MDNKGLKNSPFRKNSAKMIDATDAKNVNDNAARFAR